MKYLSFIIFTIISTLAFTGCTQAFVSNAKKLNTYDNIYDNGLCDNGFVKEQVDSGSDEILWTELAGSMKRKCQDYNASNAYFDKTEEFYKSDVDLDGVSGKSFDFVASLLINDNVNSYKGNVYEAIMVNTYKGLNFMSLGEFNNARVEFNRALDRQRRAKDEFRKEIKKLQKEQAKQPKTQNKQLNQKKSENYVTNVYSQGLFKNFRAYPDFINPFATYMAALFNISSKDYRKARDLLKESVAMAPRNKTIRSDFNLMRQALSKRGLKRKYIWLVYENGKSTIKNEFKLDLPLFLVSKKVLYTGIALPTLRQRDSSYEYLLLNGRKTRVISDMDRVIKTEFKIKLPYIIVKAVARTVAKTVAQAQLSKKSKAAGIVMAIFNAATNQSDIRSWSSLPKNFQATRVRNRGKAIPIKTDTNEILTNLKIPKNKNAIILLSSSTRGNFTSHKILF